MCCRLTVSSLAGGKATGEGVADQISSSISLRRELDSLDSLDSLDPLDPSRLKSRDSLP